MEQSNKDDIQSGRHCQDDPEGEFSAECQEGSLGPGQEKVPGVPELGGLLRPAPRLAARPGTEPLPSRDLGHTGDTGEAGQQ